MTQPRMYMCPHPEPPPHFPPHPIPQGRPSAPALRALLCLLHWKTKPLSDLVVPGANWITSHALGTPRTSGNVLYLCSLLSLSLVFLMHDICGLRETRANLLAQIRCQVLIKLWKFSLSFISSYKYLLSIYYVLGIPSGASNVFFMYPSPLSVTAFCIRFLPFLHLSVTYKPVFRAVQL